MNGDPEHLTAEDIETVLATQVVPDPPEDFPQFWTEVATELEATPMDLELVPVEVESAPPDVSTYIWTATSLGGRRIAGPVAWPENTGGPRPQWVYGHGYGSRNGCGWNFAPARKGFITLGLDARGYGRSRLDGDPSVPGWVLHGIESPKDYILRGAVADTIRAVQVARTLEGADPTRTVLKGGSFSGGLAVLAAPWISNLAYVAVSVPTFGAYSLRRTLVERGSGKEVNDYLDRVGPARAETILQSLRYFDAVNAAPYVTAPISVGLGVIDAVVPGETVAAIYHALGSRDKELLHYPCSHSTHPLTGAWRAWEEHILERAARHVGLEVTSRLTDFASPRSHIGTSS